MTNDEHLQRLSDDQPGNVSFMLPMTPRSVSLWQRFRYRIHRFRVRLGEFIAGQPFDW